MVCSNNVKIRLIFVSLIFITLLLAGPFTSFIFHRYILDRKAYADGLTQENLPPATVGSRKASLFVKVNPPILTTDNRQNAYLQLRLFDANNNETIQHVTYQITVTKGTDSSTSSSSGERPLLRDFFHAHNGLLTLKIQPAPGSVTVYGEQDPFQNAWVADPGGSVTVKGPVLLEGGLYHFQITIFGIDNDRNIFIPENAPKFDSYLSIGDVYRNIWNYQNHNYNTTLISYYDKINNKINFDPAKKSFSWSMPFNWNLTRLKQQPIFVHEEMRLPKSWKGFGDSTRFNATVNGQPLSGRSLAIDPFSFPSAMVVHYLVNKNDVLKIAEQEANQTTTNTNSSAPNSSVKTNNSTGVMRFDLITPSASAQQQQQQITTSSDLVTNTGGIHAAVSWSPNPLKPNSQTTVKISFYDPVTSNPLSTNDIKYDMIILDKKGHAIITKQSLFAKNATDSQTLTFPAKDIYQIQLQIKGLQKAGQTPDLTRNGIARGYVVVPEFLGNLTMVLLIGGLFAIIMSSKKLRRPDRWTL
ncbi:MAG TPA: hypothetical protein VE089_03615 [Nitrososphaeraceae archaeon]|jgi:hypothetical protein|nr:hypothetical protein [Nitrososphaeraceae archaeon]